MRKTLTLALVLLFAAAAPLVWAQDDPGDDALQAADESQAGTEEPGDEQVESDQGGEPEEDAAAADEPSESEAPEDASPDQEAFDADEAAESADASESDSAAVDESADTMAQADEEEEAEDSTGDEDSLASDDAAAEFADGGAQTSDGADGEGAAADSASTGSSEPAPAPTQSQPAPNPTPTAVPAANTGGNQGSGGTEWPRANYRFMVDIGMGEGEVPFQEVSGLDVETQIIEYRADNSPTFSTIKMPGIQKSGSVTLKKGIFAKDNKFFEWQRNIKLNTTQRTTVTIKLLDDSGAPVMTWTLKNAWPSKVTGTDMKSDGNETAVESIEIVHEGVTVSQ